MNQFFITAIFFMAMVSAGLANDWTVTEVLADGEIKVALRPGETASVGDTVAVSFIIPGLGETAKKADGVVVGVKGETFTVKIDQATRTGVIAVGDLVEQTERATVKTVMPTSTELTPTRKFPAPAPLEKSSAKVVPDDFPTIQKAIDAAVAGDVVHVKRGIYHETLIIRKDGIEIRGEDKSSTVLRYPDQSEWEKSHLVVIEGSKNVTISGMALEFAGVVTEKNTMFTNLIQVSQGGLTLVECRFEGGEKISGIRAYACDLEVRDCEFDQCNWSINVDEESKANIEKCSVRNTEITGIAVLEGASATISKTSVQASGSWGIEVVNNRASATIRQCTVTGCNDGGIWFNRSATGIVEECRLSDNQGIGIYIIGEGTDPLVRKNHCNNNQYGIAVGEGSSPALFENQCYENRASGIVVSGAKTNPQIISNIASRNGDFGIAVDEGTSPEKFEDNSGSGNKSADLNRSANFE